MKRIILIFILLLGSMGLTAQNRGERYLAGTISTSLDYQHFDYYNDKSLSSQSILPLTTAVGLGVEWGFFVADRLRLSLGFGIPFSSSPSTLMNQTGQWSYSSTIGIQVNPNVAYYLELADKFFYCPEIGAAFDFGKLFQEKNALTNDNKSTYSGWTAYAHLLSFEYRISPKVALGIGSGTVRYSYVKVKKDDPKTDSHYVTRQFKFELNSAALLVRFYL